MNNSRKKLTLDQLIRTTKTRVPFLVLAEPAMCYLLGLKPKRNEKTQNPQSSQKPKLTLEQLSPIGQASKKMIDRIHSTINEKVNQLLKDGDGHLVKIRYEEALKCFELAREMGHESPKLFFTIGFCHLKLGNYQDAIPFFDKHLEQIPDDVNALLNLSHCFFELGNYKRSKAFCEAIIELDPSKSAAYNNLGLCYEKLRKISKADKCFKKAIELDPGCVQAYNNINRLRSTHLPPFFLRIVFPLLSILLVAFGITLKDYYHWKKHHEVKAAIEQRYEKKGPDALLNALKEGDEYTKTEAAFMLYHHPDIRSIPLLTKALSDENECVRKGALWAFESISGNMHSKDQQKIIPPLIKILEDDNANNQSEAALLIKNLAKFHPHSKILQNSIPSLINLLKDGDEYTWYNAIVALSEFQNHPKVTSEIALFEKRLGADDVYVRMRAAWFLSHIALNTPKNLDLLDSVPSLIKCLSDKSSGVRKHASYALGTIVKNTGDKTVLDRALPHLKRLQSDPKCAEAANYVIRTIENI